jgi:hypothetical protein
MGERTTTKMESQLYLGKNRLRATRELVAETSSNPT